MKIVVVFFSIIIFYACKSSIDLDYLKSTGWSYDKGYRVTDFINFKQSMGYMIKGDTLFFDGKPRAIIINIDKKSYTLTIGSLDRKDIGYYMDEQEMLK